MSKEAFDGVQRELAARRGIEEDKVLFEVTHRQVIGEVVQGHYSVMTDRDSNEEVMTENEAAMYLIARNDRDGVYEFPGKRITVETVDA